MCIRDSRDAGWRPTESNVVCVHHFDKKYVQDYGGRVYLTKDAVPTVYPEQTPQHLRLCEEREPKRTDPNERKATFERNVEESYSHWLDEDTQKF